MDQYLIGMASAAATLAAVTLATGGLTVALGRRFITEFTRPGVTITPDSPQWGGWKFPTEDAEPPLASQRALSFTAADGIALRGEFWAQPQPAPTMIISHGFHLPCVHFRSVAALEYAKGANVLLFDYRGHGASAAQPTTCGNAEINDLAAAVEAAVRQPETTPGKIYIHGFSMGAAVAILMPPHPAVAGIIADSPYARLGDMMRMIIAQIFRHETSGWRRPFHVVRACIPLLTRLTFVGGRLLFRVRFRRPLVASTERAIAAQAHAFRRGTNAVPPPPILLIHAEHDPLISLRHAHRLAAIGRKVGRTMQVYYTPCAIHCGSYGYDPRRYNRLIQEFLDTLA